MDLAVGMIIGSAFTAIVTSLKDNFIQPILDFVTRAHTSEYYTKEVLLGYLSAFVSAIINFIKRKKCLPHPQAKFVRFANLKFR